MPARGWESLSILSQETCWHKYLAQAPRFADLRFVCASPRLGRTRSLACEFRS
jgi:hypothetical protein